MTNRGVRNTLAGAAGELLFSVVVVVSHGICRIPLGLITERRLALVGGLTLVQGHVSGVSLI